MGTSSSTEWKDLVTDNHKCEREQGRDAVRREYERETNRDGEWGSSQVLSYEKQEQNRNTDSEKPAFQGPSRTRNKLNRKEGRETTIYLSLQEMAWCLDWVGSYR